MDSRLIPFQYTLVSLFFFLFTCNYLTLKVIYCRFRRLSKIPLHGGITQLSDKISKVFAE